jgi:hypothetical protein
MGSTTVYMDKGRSSLELGKHRAGKTVKLSNTPYGTNGKTDSSVKAIDTEIVAVHCEDPPDAFAFSHSDERRIREIHRLVGI